MNWRKNKALNKLIKKKPKKHQSQQCSSGNFQVMYLVLSGPSLYIAVQCLLIPCHVENFNSQLFLGLMFLLKIQKMCTFFNMG